MTVVIADQLDLFDLLVSEEPINGCPGSYLRGCSSASGPRVTMAAQAPMNNAIVYKATVENRFTQIAASSSETARKTQDGIAIAELATAAKRNHFRNVRSHPGNRFGSVRPSIAKAIIKVGKTCARSAADSESRVSMFKSYRDAAANITDQKMPKAQPHTRTRSRSGRLE